MKEKLTIGKTALFNHCDVGYVDEEIKERIPLDNFYIAILKKVHMKNTKNKEAAYVYVNLLLRKNEVIIFVRSQDFIKYID